jgi:hypothetical protein
VHDEHQTQPAFLLPLVRRMLGVRLPKVTVGGIGLVLLLVALLLFLLGRGLYGAGEEKPISRNEIQQSAPSSGAIEDR